MRYATLDQMQGMEFGCHGSRFIQVPGFEKIEVEMLTDRDGSLFGYATIFRDEDGNMIDWDRIDEAEARELGLIK